MFSNKNCESSFTNLLKEVGSLAVADYSVWGRPSSVLPLSIIDVIVSLTFMSKDTKKLATNEKRTKQEPGTSGKLEGTKNGIFPIFLHHRCIFFYQLMTRPKNKSALRYLSEYGSPRYWPKIFLSESVSNRTPHTPGHHQAAPISLHAVMCHSVNSCTFVQKIIEMQLLTKNDLTGTLF